MRRAIVQICAFIAGILPAFAAFAQVYKWVDQNGVTNYSNERPPETVVARKLTGNENPVSVYSPDEGLLRATQAMREQRARAAAMPLTPEPQYAPAPWGPLTPYEQCLASGRVGCDRLYGEYTPPWYYPVYYPAYPRRIAPPGRPPPVAKPVSTPGREAVPHAAPRNQRGAAAPQH